MLAAALATWPTAAPLPASTSRTMVTVLLAVTALTAIVTAL